MYPESVNVISSNNSSTVEEVTGSRAPTKIATDPHPSPHQPTTRKKNNRKRKKTDLERSLQRRNSDPQQLQLKLSDQTHRHSSLRLQRSKKDGTEQEMEGRNQRRVVTGELRWTWEYEEVRGERRWVEWASFTAQLRYTPSDCEPISLPPHSATAEWAN